MAPYYRHHGLFLFFVVFLCFLLADECDHSLGSLITLDVLCWEIILLLYIIIFYMTLIRLIARCHAWMVHTANHHTQHQPSTYSSTSINHHYFNLLSHHIEFNIASLPNDLYIRRLAPATHTLHHWPSESTPPRTSIISTHILWNFTFYSMSHYCLTLEAFIQRHVPILGSRRRLRPALPTVY